MIRRVILGVAVMLGGAVWAAAGDSSIRYRVHFDDPGPYGNDELVSGSVWIDWTAPEQGQPGVGVAGGTFVLCMDGPGMFLLPEERVTDQLGEPLPPGRTPWLEGRRPAWIAGGEDGFRHPTAGGTFGLNYLITGAGDDTCLAATIADQASGILYGQPRASLVGELFVADPSFELFRFRLETPESGAGLLGFVTSGGGATYLTSPDATIGVPFDRVIHVGAEISYVPEPAAITLLVIGFAVGLRLRRVLHKRNTAFTAHGHPDRAERVWRVGTPLLLASLLGMSRFAMGDESRQVALMRLGDQWCLSLPDGEPFYCTERAIFNERAHIIRGVPLLVALWDEQAADGSMIPGRAIAPDGEEFFAAGPIDPRLRLRYAWFDPIRDGEPSMADRQPAPLESQLWIV